MNEPLLYHTSMAFFGGVFGLTGVSSLLSEGIGILTNANSGWRRWNGSQYGLCSYFLQ